jgi:uncharacterized repeat protein (TIGR03803 family)
VKKLNWLKTAGALCGLLAVSAIEAPAQTFTTLYSFCAVFGCPDGDDPLAPLVQGTNGNFYGTVRLGGTGGGTIFEITPEGGLSTVLDGGTDGYNFNYGLVLGADGNFYGTATNGGNHGGGTLFKMTRTGVTTVLYNFCQKGGCTDGNSPWCALVEGTDGDFYGTTYSGGTDGYGTVFRITPGGVLTTLHFFQYTDGAYPLAGLVQASNGNFYGTSNGGYGCEGTVFEMTPEGTLTTLHCFAGGSDGAYPANSH